MAKIDAQSVHDSENELPMEPVTTTSIAETEKKKSRFGLSSMWPKSSSASSTSMSGLKDSLKRLSSFNNREKRDYISEKAQSDGAEPKSEGDNAVAPARRTRSSDSATPSDAASISTRKPKNIGRRALRKMKKALKRAGKAIGRGLCAVLAILVVGTVATVTFVLGTIRFCLPAVCAFLVSLTP
ncbi:hypothetical protein MKEN_00171000 [Mycena kentingensis (nom. inval.)]|nr:hypothetical protein MKEN_00171000 [Mycena kentingensis (nom. inval.)]